MHVPFSEMIKSIPGFVGIRLEEELPYKVLKTIGEIEIREYEPFTLARTQVFGVYDSAMETCFRDLAEFIFGKNATGTVTEMTTPVFIDRKGDEWTMSFYLTPESAGLVPQSPAVFIEQMPKKTVAVYQFTNTFDETAMEESHITLLEEVNKAGLRTTSDVWWAQFDQPVSVPLTKRNEAMVCIEWFPQTSL